MRADDVILFSQVVELGSFRQAADANAITSSVVSKRIARLEAELGIQLLYRTTRKLTLTEAGHVLLKGAIQLKSVMQEATDAVEGMGESLSGHIKMSVPTISGDLILADAVAEFCQKNPSVTVDMSLDNRFVDLIDGGYDLVIRTGYLEDSSLIARHILDSHWVVCASPSYLAKQGRPNKPNELCHHNCLQYVYQTSGAQDWAFKDGDHVYTVHVEGNFSTDNASALRKAALGGYGIAYVPRCLVYHDIRSGELVDIFPERVAKILGVYAVYPQTKHLPEKVRLLITHIKQRYLAISHYF